MNSDQAVDLELAWIVRDPELQVRGPLNEDAVATFAEDMRAGDPFPPVVVYCEGARYWLSQGFHRCAAAESIGWETIPTIVRSGTRSDAIHDAAGSNQEGDKVPQLRTSGQKARAIEMVLKDQSGWPKKERWTQERIASHCSVTQQLVSYIKGRLYKVCMSESESVGGGGKSCPATTGRAAKDDDPSPSYSQGLPQHTPLPGQASFLEDDEGAEESAEESESEQVEEPSRPASPPKSKFEVIEAEFHRRTEQWSVLMNTVGMHGGIVNLSEAWGWSEPMKDQMATWFGAVSREFRKYSEELEGRTRS